MNDKQGCSKGRLFVGQSRVLTLNDLRATRIPGVRKVIKYGAENKLTRSRCWLFICLVVASVMIYNVSHYVRLYKDQRITIIRSYHYSKQVAYPKIVMCTPTSHSFSRLASQEMIIPYIMSNLESNNIYLSLLLSNLSKMSSSDLFEMLELKLNRTIVRCTFQTKPCDLSFIRLYRSSSHACFQFDMHKAFSTSWIGRDGGLDILVNLNSFDGIANRLGLSGGLKVIFVDSGLMQMADRHDVVYAETGRLNSLSLVSHRRNYIVNCTSVENSPFLEGKVNMQQNQIAFYEEYRMHPCALRNYYTTKTSSRLRSSVVYQSMLPAELIVMQRNAAVANYLRSRYTVDIRNRDLDMTRQMLSLSHGLVDAVVSWNEPVCANIRNHVNAQASSSYIRGKSEEVHAYATRLLDDFGNNIDVYTDLYRKGVRDAMIYVLPYFVGSNVSLDDTAIAILQRVGVEYHAWGKIIIDTVKRGNQIIEVLANANIFSEYSKIDEWNQYFQSHDELVGHIIAVTKCALDNSNLVMKNISFIHTGSFRCKDWNNLSIDYGECPDELACPDFANSYVEKYNIPRAVMIDSSPPPYDTEYASIYNFCAVSIWLKDMLRSIHFDFKVTYDEWFYLHILNKLAVAKWDDDKLFDGHDLACKTFQSCARLVSPFMTTGTRSHIRVGAARQAVMYHIGKTGFDILYSCRQCRDEAVVSLEKYLYACHEAVVVPYENMISMLVKFRNLLPIVRAFKPPRLLVRNHADKSLILQFENHLQQFIHNSNLSDLAHFLNRKGKIMVGEVLIYNQEVQFFIAANQRRFRSIYLQSRFLYWTISKDSSYRSFSQQLVGNVTSSVLSSNFSHSLSVVWNTMQCASQILTSLNETGDHVMQRLAKWLASIGPLRIRAKQYENAETLNADFVKNNFVRLEVYYEDLAQRTEEEQYPISGTKLVSILGALGRFYMGLKIFNVAEFLGPILVFLAYRVYLCIF